MKHGRKLKPKTFVVERFGYSHRGQILGRGYRWDSTRNKAILCALFHHGECLELMDRQKLLTDYEIDNTGSLVAIRVFGDLEAYHQYRKTQAS